MGRLREALTGTAICAVAARENRIEWMIGTLLTLSVLGSELVRAALHGSLPHEAITRRRLDALISWHPQ